MMIRTLTAFALVAVSATAFAQNIAGEPNFGTVTLETGFIPDPHEVTLVAGGSTQVTQSGCNGFVSDSPDVDLHYTAGETFPLNIYVTSDSDTTLLVNLPDGTWVCNDDTSGLNPALSFESPQSGLYNIWVGSYSDDEMPAATLKISEIAPQW